MNKKASRWVLFFMVLAGFWNGRALAQQDLTEDQGLNILKSTVESMKSMSSFRVESTRTNKVGELSKYTEWFRFNTNGSIDERIDIADFNISNGKPRLHLTFVLNETGFWSVGASNAVKSLQNPRPVRLEDYLMSALVNQKGNSYRLKSRDGDFQAVEVIFSSDNKKELGRLKAAKKIRKSALEQGYFGADIAGCIFKIGKTNGLLYAQYSETRGGDKKPDFDYVSVTKNGAESPDLFSVQDFEKIVPKTPQEYAVHTMRQLDAQAGRPLAPTNIYEIIQNTPLPRHSSKQKAILLVFFLVSLVPLILLVKKSMRKP